MLRLAVLAAAGAVASLLAGAAGGVPPELASRPQGEIRGIPVTGAPGIRRTTDELNAAAQGRPRYLPVRRRATPTRGGARADVLAQTAATPSPQLAASFSFLGGTLSESGFRPPDSQGDIGPTQYLMAINGRIKVFDKSGTLGALNTSLSAFFSPVITPSAFTSDPRVRFDRLSNRWFVTCIDALPPNFPPNRILIAVSDGPTITGGTVWTFFQFRQDLVGGGNADAGLFADFPTLGVDANALYFGLNMFDGNSYEHSTAFVVRKSSLLSGGPIVVTAFRDVTGGFSAGPYTPQGVDNPDPAATQGYVVGVDVGFFSLLQLRRISDPGGTPSLSGNLSVSVPSTYFPVFPGVTALGSSKPLDTIDDRLSEAVIRGGKLYVAHNIGVNSSGVGTSARTRTAMRWYELGNLGTSPSLLRSGTIFDPAASNPVSYWMGSLNVSGQGHALLGTSAAGTLQRPLGVTASMLSSQSAFDPPQTYVGGGAFAYDVGTENPNRWGDYSRTSVDPCDDQTFWTIQMFVAGTNNWGVQIGKIPAPPPAQPISASPPTVMGGIASTNVTITGTSSAGSAFFDPGFGTCRLAASIPGGVTVNSVSFVDTTHALLNVSTVGATVGAETVTMTNPDAQAATSAAPIFTVLGLAPANLGSPQVLGSPVVGSTLSADRGVWNAAFPAPVFTYQWKKCNTAGLSCVDIGGATASTYVPVIADIGFVVKVSVTGTNSEGSASALSTSRSPSDTLIRPASPGR